MPKLKLTLGFSGQYPAARSRERMASGKRADLCQLIVDQENNEPAPKLAEYEWTRSRVSASLFLPLPT